MSSVEKTAAVVTPPTGAAVAALLRALGHLEADYGITVRALKQALASFSPAASVSLSSESVACADIASGVLEFFAGRRALDPEVVAFLEDCGEDSEEVLVGVAGVIVCAGLESSRSDEWVEAVFRLGEGERNALTRVVESVFGADDELGKCGKERAGEVATNEAILLEKVLLLERRLHDAQEREREILAEAKKKKGPSLRRRPMSMPAGAMLERTSVSINKSELAELRLKAAAGSGVGALRRELREIRLKMTDIEAVAGVFRDAEIRAMARVGMLERQVDITSKKGEELMRVNVEIVGELERMEEEIREGKFVREELERNCKEKDRAITEMVIAGCVYEDGESVVADEPNSDEDVNSDEDLVERDISGMKCHQVIKSDLAVVCFSAECGEIGRWKKIWSLVHGIFKFPVEGVLRLLLLDRRTRTEDTSQT